MKRAGGAALRYCAKPDPASAGALLYGGEAMRVAAARQELVAALVGPDAAAEMREIRLAAAEIRKDPAALSDALKARGFFAGPRAVVVEDATDTLAPVAAAALADWRQDDARLVVTAGALPARSALRKLFETHPSAMALAFYDDPPGRDEIEAVLARAGLGEPPSAAMAAIEGLAQTLDPGEFRQTVERIALYKLGDPAPLEPAEVAALAPATVDAAADDVVAVVADGKIAEIGPLVRRLAAGGVGPVTLCLAALRHFRALHAAAADPGGPGAGIARLRPPVFGPRRDQLLRQAQSWGMHRLETAIELLLDTDLALRSSAKAPAMAVVERALVRLAMLGRR